MALEPPMTPITHVLFAESPGKVPTSLSPKLHFFFLCQSQPTNRQPQHRYRPRRPAPEARSADDTTIAIRVANGLPLRIHRSTVEIRLYRHSVRAHDRHPSSNDRIILALPRNL